MDSFLNLQIALFNGVGEYGIPEIQPVYEADPSSWIQFDYAKRTKRNGKKTGIHFFEDDYKFERLWNAPNKYIPLLKNFNCVLSPDFSMYSDFPKAVQIFNHYRRHWLAAYWQTKGIKVIPTIGWVDKDSYDWCFTGEPKESIIAVSNVGCMQNKEARRAFEDGYKEMLIRLQPKEVLFYTRNFDDYPGPVRYIKYVNWKGSQEVE